MCIREMKYIKNYFLTVSKLFFVWIFVCVLLFVLCLEFINLIKIREFGKMIVRAENGFMPVLSKPLSNDEGTASYYDAAILAGDARPLVIKKYLERYKSPLAPYSDLIFELSQSYNFDYRWIIAIAQQESNLCKKMPLESYNCWGYGIHANGVLRFDDYELALRSFAEYLKREYFDKGYDTPELIMTKYCPHSDGSWAFGIRQFFTEMENGEF